MIKSTLIFTWTFLKQLVVYTISVIPAAFMEAVQAVKNRKIDTFNPPVRFEQGDYHHRRKRRGHRGGRKHKRFNH